MTPQTKAPGNRPSTTSKTPVTKAPATARYMQPTLSTAPVVLGKKSTGRRQTATSQSYNVLPITLSDNTMISGATWGELKERAMKPGWIMSSQFVSSVL